MRRRSAVAVILFLSCAVFFFYFATTTSIGKDRVVSATTEAPSDGGKDTVVRSIVAMPLDATKSDGNAKQSGNDAGNVPAAVLFQRQQPTPEPTALGYREALLAQATKYERELSALNSDELHDPRNKCSHIIDPSLHDKFEGAVERFDLEPLNDVGQLRHHNASVCASMCLGLDDCIAFVFNGCRCFFKTATRPLIPVATFSLVYMKKDLFPLWSSRLFDFRVVRRFTSEQRHRLVQYSSSVYQIHVGCVSLTISSSELEENGEGSINKNSSAAATSKKKKKKKNFVLEKIYERDNPSMPSMREGQMRQLLRSALSVPANLDKFNDGTFYFCIFSQDVAEHAANLDRIQLRSKNMTKELLAPSLGVVSDGLSPWHIAVPCYTFQSWVVTPMAPFYEFYDNIVNDSNPVAAMPFRQRIDKMVWRGECRFRIGRWDFVDKFSNLPEDFDVACSTANTSFRTGAAFLTIEDVARYRYVVDLPGYGSGYSGRLKYLFLLGSVVVIIRRPHVEYWDPMFVPWVHYVPIYDNREVLPTLLMLRRDVHLAERIAHAGRERAKLVFSREYVYEAMTDVVSEYTKGRAVAFVGLRSN